MLESVVGTTGGWPEGLWLGVENTDLEAHDDEVRGAFVTPRSAGGAVRALVLATEVPPRGELCGSGACLHGEACNLRGAVAVRTEQDETGARGDERKEAVRGSADEGDDVDGLRRPPHPSAGQRLRRERRVDTHRLPTNCLDQRRSDARQQRVSGRENDCVPA